MTKRQVDSLAEEFSKISNIPLEISNDVPVMRALDEIFGIAVNFQHEYLQPNSPVENLIVDYITKVEECIEDHKKSLKTKRKIIFLDIDGVLSIMSTSYRTHGVGDSDVMEPMLVQRLNYLMERLTRDSKFEVEIVLSSSWLMIPAKTELKRLGFKFNKILNNRTNRHLRYRGEQIKNYLTDNYSLDVTSKNYMVIEDEINDVCGGRCSEIPRRNVMEVNMNEGISDLNIIQIIRKLNHVNYDAQTFDGKFEFNIKTYEKFYNLGFDTQVLLRKKSFGDIDFKAMDWTHFTLDLKNMLMVLEK